MSKRVISYGVSVGGKPELTHRPRFLQEFAEQFPDGERFVATFDKPTRSHRQNALYWLWCTKVGLERGWEKEYTHYLNKLTCNRKTVFIINVHTGELNEDVYPASTADLSVDAFAEFMQRVQQRWAGEGIDLPSPNDEEYAEREP